MKTNAEAVPAACAALLSQAAEAIRGLSDAEYAAPGARGASIGQHVRHAVDHIGALLDGFENDRVTAYDHRERGTAIETDRAAALARIAELRSRVDGLDEVQLGFELTIRVMLDGDGAEVEIPTTLLRELAFVTHHAIHHHAMILSIAAEHGATLPEGFGRAPSTQKHDRESAGTGA